MKIVHTEASCGWGGQEIRILNEARGMIARGHAVELLCPPEARIAEEAPRFGVPVTKLPIARKNVRGALAIRRWLQQHDRQIDVINSHSSTDSWLTAIALATIPGAPPLVRTRHISAPVPRNPATYWLYQRASSMIVTTGEALRQTLISENQYDADRLISIPTGIDAERFSPPPAHDRDAARQRFGVADRFSIGIVATLRSWKGHRYLIEAVRAHEKTHAGQHWHLFIVGDGPQRMALEEQVDALAMREQVTFAGDQVDVLPWLHALDVFVLPSYANEGVPQAILQAMACGLPVVTTHAGAISEVALVNETALVVPIESPLAIQAAIESLEDDPALSARIGSAGRARIVECHGYDLMLSRMESVFAMAIERKHRV